MPSIASSVLTATFSHAEIGFEYGELRLSDASDSDAYKGIAATPAKSRCLRLTTAKAITKMA